ncbi:MAG: PEP-CTERM sorting domain-containing protein [Dechloromonas sp.]|nr:MAG: PEP-CTERM sorting domain-containing protein [Dechloromonas sp.]
MIRHTYRFLGLALGVSLAFSANALPTLSFVERTGVVGPNDVVDIRLRLTADSGGLSFDSASPVSLDSLRNWLNLNYGSHYTRLDNVYTTIAIGCAGDTFRPTCYNTDGPYSFGFSHDFYGRSSLSLAAGAAVDFLFGQYTPRWGGVPTGDYALRDAAVLLVLSGARQVEVETYDEYGNPTGMSWKDEEIRGWYQGLAGTCPWGAGADCQFERTVRGSTSQVPEPALPALVLAGLFGLWATRRNRACGR